MQSQKANFFFQVQTAWIQDEYGVNVVYDVIKGLIVYLRDPLEYSQKKTEKEA